MTAVLSLALGIGATVAVFSVIWDAVLHPWPYAGADRICVISMADGATVMGTPPLTGSEIRQLGQTHSVEDVVASTREWLTSTGSDVPEDVVASATTANTFLFLGVPPMLGRYILPSDAPEGGEVQPVTVLTYGFWMRHFGGDPSVVGKKIELDHKSYTIVGVMPSRFRWQEPDIYLPLGMRADENSFYETLVKLRKGVSLAAADAEFAPLFVQFNKERGYLEQFPPRDRVALQTLSGVYVRDLRHTMNLLLVAVVLLLAIGCANLSILLLARGTARQHEFAVRAAVGASRGRMVQQLLTESLLLAFAGAALGVLFSYKAVGFIVARLPARSFPGESDFHVHMPILLFSVGLAILSGVVFGLAPALEMSRPQLGEAMQAGSHRMAGSVRGRRIHTALIAGQIALTLVLLSAAGAAVEGFSWMMHRPLGFDPHRVMSVGIPMGRNIYPTRTGRAAYYQQLRDRVAVTPGVVSAAIGGNATPPYNGWTWSFNVLGRTALEQQGARVSFVGPEYFSVLRIPLIEGRVWDGSEIARGAGLVVVNQTFAHQYFPKEHAMGHSIRFTKMIANNPPYFLSAPWSNDWLEIIGVVGDAVNSGLDAPVAPAIYAPNSLLVWMGTNIFVRTQGEPLAILHSVQEQIASVNPDQPVFSGTTDLEEEIRREPEWGRIRLFSILLGAFAGIALLLAAMGLYSVVSYGVAQRTREFGIRMALGAQRAHVLRLVARSGALSVAIGVAAGLALSLGLSRLIARWMVDAANSPFIALSVSGLMIVVAAAACIVPALRAAAIDPMTALRTE